ncbi:MAG: arginine deiminase-related protein [Pseudomonadota bacterium]
MALRSEAERVTETAAPAPRLSSAAYGGAGWQPRTVTHRAEIGTHWRACGIADETSVLRTVLLSPPGQAFAAASAAPDAAQFLAPVALEAALAEHRALADLYRAEGVEVLEVPASPTHPNQIFCADLFVMTPEGAILARPASAVRAGEEVAVAAALAAARVPILATLRRTATFEGADLMWLSPQRALLGLGARTNEAAAGQFGGLLGELGVRLEVVDMPIGTMHLMGMLRIFAPGLAVAWPRRLAHRAVAILREEGYRVALVPEGIAETEINTGLNAVTLAPGRILMPAGQPAMRRFFEAEGVTVVETPMQALRKAAGAVGCLTGIIHRS